MDAHETNPEAEGPVNHTQQEAEFLRADGEFPRRIAHAMRSPLGLIRGAVKELADAQREGRTLQPERLLDFALRGTAQLERMADRLSLAGRMQQGEDLHRVPCDLVALTRAALADVQAARSRRRVQVCVELPVSAFGAGDPHLLKMAIAELIDNALRLARERIDIALSASPIGASVVVKDDGDATRGVPMLGSSLVHPAADGTGLGLGLGLAQRVVALHGGAISLTRGDGAEPNAPGLIVRFEVPEFSVRD